MNRSGDQRRAFAGLDRLQCRVDRIECDPAIGGIDGAWLEPARSRWRDVVEWMAGQVAALRGEIAIAEQSHRNLQSAEGPKDHLRADAGRVSQGDGEGLHDG